MTLKVTREIAEKRILGIHRGNIIILEYTRMNAMGRFKCNICGYEWYTNSSSVINGGCGCDVCVDRKNGDKLFKSINEVIEIIESYGCVLVSNEYFGDNKPLDICMSCGHIDKYDLSYFKKMKQKICRKCKKEVYINKVRLPISEVIFHIESYNFKFIEFRSEYVGNKTKIIIECPLGHINKTTINDFRNNPHCIYCKKIETVLNQTGSKSHLWTGGKSKMSMFLEKRIEKWKRDSMESCNYKCIITGDRFDQIHHLYPMNKIISEIFINLNINKKSKLSDYSDNEINLIIQECRRLHEIYPLGVCLRRDIHQLFHSIYGNRNSTPENFYEFQSRIESGDIII